jgi:hypothetical protein
MGAANAMPVEPGHSIPVSQYASSTISNPQSVAIDGTLVENSSAGSFIQEPVDFSSLVRHIEPQQWTDPFNMDWDQWDAIMASLGTTS